MRARHFEVIAAEILNVNRRQAQSRSGGKKIKHELLLVLQALGRNRLVEVFFRQLEIKELCLLGLSSFSWHFLGLAGTGKVNRDRGVSGMRVGRGIGRDIECIRTSRFQGEA